MLSQPRCLPPTLVLVAVVTLTGFHGSAMPAEPPIEDYCRRLEQSIQGRKHGFLAGNLSYYVGGFHASWKLIEHETLGLTHPFRHDLRSRGVGLAKSQAQGADNTGFGNDFSGWEFYKDTRVLYGTVLVDGREYEHPIPTRMIWRPDRTLIEYDVAGIKIREDKFVASNDAICTTIRASRPVRIRFHGNSFFGRHSIRSTAKAEFIKDRNLIHIQEGGTTYCVPDTDRKKRIAPIMYENQHVILSASVPIQDSIEIRQGEHGEQHYSFEVSCNQQGTSLVWSMHPNQDAATAAAVHLLEQREAESQAKTRSLNLQLSHDIPAFRCSDPKFVQIYYYLWSLYLAYYIDIQQGWEQEPHTQTAVNNFLGIHRYDATFQIPVSAWTRDQARYAHGNVLTWKHLFANRQFRRHKNGVIALPDNKGVSWHSGVFGLEHSEYVLGAWQIFQHTGDVEFLTRCYRGFFREMFWEGIPGFFMNQFEVAEVLQQIAERTGNESDIEHWQSIVSLEPERIRRHFDQRWEVNGHSDYFGGPRNDMLMTNGMWAMRNKHFPREFASRMVRRWALNDQDGFMGEFFPLAMSKKGMRTFKTKVDHSFGYTPDTAYFTLIGMFRQQLGREACDLTINHLSNYNFHSDWDVPVAPEAYNRDGGLFGDQYSNFNAGKLLLFLEGLAGLKYSQPKQLLRIRDTMPPDWQWMEVDVPLRDSQRQTQWANLRWERTNTAGRITKSLHVRDGPQNVQWEPWLEGQTLNRIEQLKSNDHVSSPPIAEIDQTYHYARLPIRDGSDYRSAVSYDRSKK